MRELDVHIADCGSGLRSRGCFGGVGLRIAGSTRSCAVARQGRVRAGFTLIELLIVIFILGILVALAGGIARYVFREASRKETRTTQTIVMTAVGSYQEIVGEYPDLPNNDDDDLISAAELLTVLKGEEADSELTDAQKEQVMQTSREILLKLDGKAMDGVTIRDGYGNPMGYDVDGGLAGRPVLISAGPDGDIETTEDNIRSDGG